jgi:hypothetical protein
MKKILLGLLLIFTFGFSISQEVILDMDVEEQYKGTKGPNMRHYGHFYLGGGFVVDFDEEPGTEIKWWRSGQFVFGYRYKLKLLSFYALGLGVRFTSTQYFFEGKGKNSYDILNPLTYNLERDRHYLLNNGIGLEAYQRINVGRRGNTLGKYLDTGIWSQWNIGNVEDILIRPEDDDVPSRRIRIKNRQLTYVESIAYGVTVRIGFNKFLVYGNYRLSDHFKKEITENYPVDIPELSRLSLGVQVAL